MEIEVLICSRCDWTLRVTDEEPLPQDCPQCKGASWVDQEWLTRDELQMSIQEEEEDETDIDPFWYSARAMDRIDVSAGMRWGSLED